MSLRCTPVAPAQPEGGRAVVSLPLADIVRWPDREASHPGTAATVAERFTAQPHHTFVLVAIGERTAGPTAQGPG